MSSAALRSSSFLWATSTRAACQADQWPETSAQSESEATYATLLIQPVAIEIGIMAIQRIVSHPFIRCMNTGSPWMDTQRDLTYLVMTTNASWPLASWNPSWRLSS
jgi:hypothetical protein